jgi:hypothetical protein
MYIYVYIYIYIYIYIHICIHLCTYTYIPTRELPILYMIAAETAKNVAVDPESTNDTGNSKSPCLMMMMIFT